MTEAIKIDLVKEEEKKTEKTLSNNLLKKIMNDEVYDKEVRNELLATESNEDFVKVLMKHSPTTSFDSFMADYSAWALNPTKDLRQLTYVSRFRNLLGSFIYGTPESQNMPFYFYYSLQDKVRSAPFHFSTEYKQFDKYRLFVNRYTRYFRQKMTNTLCTWLIVFGLAMGFIIKPFIIEVKEQVQEIKDISTIRDNGEQRIDDYTSKYEELKSQNISKAKEIKTQYESGEITAEEFNTKALEIKAKDKELNDNFAKYKIQNDSQINIDIAIRKNKDSEYIQNLRDSREEELKKLETKGE